MIQLVAVAGQRVDVTVFRRQLLLARLVHVGQLLAVVGPGLQALGGFDPALIVLIAIADDVLLRQQGEVVVDDLHRELILEELVIADCVNHVALRLGQGLDRRVVPAKPAQQRLGQVH